MRKDARDPWNLIQMLPCHPQTSVTGRVTLELSQLRFSRIIFQYSHRAKPADETALPPHPRQTLYLPSDLEAVRITLEEPPAGQFPALQPPRCIPAADEVLRTVHLDRERGAILCIDCGRNEVVRLSLRCTVADQNLHFDLARAEAIDFSGKSRLLP